VLDISPWAEAAKDHFLRNPLTQRLPRKFKINFSGCATDCGQAMFNDIGVIAVTRALPDGTTEPGFRVFMAGGLGANPHPALAIEEFTARDDLMATIEAALRVWSNFGNRDNKLRARMKWLVDTMGIDELRERIIKERKLLIGSATYPGGVPAVVEAAGDAPAGMGTESITDLGSPIEFSGLSPYAKWELANVVRGRANGTVSAYAHCHLGDITPTQSRGLASDIDRALEEAGLAEVGGVRINISGCTNSCVQHHISDIGFFGLERRAHGKAAPGYQMLLGGRVGDMEIEFGQKAVKLPAKSASEAVVRVVGKFTADRQAGESFATWLERSGGAAQVGTTLADLDEFPDPAEQPDFYIDFGETGPYVKEVGDSECAT